MSLEGLQQVIDTSRERARPFARKLFSGPPPTAVQVQTVIHDSGDLTVATASASGRPHAALTIGDCVDGIVYFTATEGSLLARNLEARPDVAFTCEGIMAAGKGEPVCRCSEQPPDLDPALAILCDKVTDHGFDGTLWSVTLRRLMS